MQSFTNKKQLFTLIKQGALLITPNNRLSESLIQDYFNYSQNETVDKPSCLPYASVLTKAYEELIQNTPERLLPTLLSPAQSRFLWRKIIKSNSELTFSEGLLESVIRSWQHAQQWQLDSEDPAFYYTPQTRQFQQWWHWCTKELTQKNLITEEQLVPYLIAAHSHPLPKPVVWVCFDDFTPEQKALQDYWNTKGIDQYTYDLEEQATKPQLLSAENDTEEYQQLVRWLHIKLKEGHQSIGVVIPDLQQKSHKINRLLAQEFPPSLYNISLGQTLGEFPLIAHALCWLNLESNYLSNHEATLLLQSPYLAAAQEEFLKRSEYQQESRLLERPKISLSVLAQELEEQAPKLASIISKITPFPKKATIEEWIHLFHERLHTLGFPGDYGLSSENYQCMNRFTLIFDEFRQLNALSHTLTQIQALEALEDLVNHTIFQAQKTKALIHISGLLEASGCAFDCLWIMGLTSQCLPQKVHLSAFIPPEVQRRLMMPHSDPARELHFAKHTLKRLENASKNLIFSYAQLEGDNPNLPCSLITTVEHFEPLPRNTPSPDYELITIEEHFQIPIKATEMVSGGTAILANQAKCPFKAFAEHRLRAKASTKTSECIDAKEKGKISHKVMELLWKKLESQYKLLELDPPVLNTLITEVIHTALAPLIKEHSDSGSASIIEIESIRLKKLVLKALEWEKQRPPFTVVALEQSYTIHLAGLDFQVRIDRLDKSADKKWVIDYKSSLPAAKPWNEQRPKEPQLLMYALLDQDINTLVFLQLKSGTIECSGLSETKQEIKGITPLKKEEIWEDLRKNWQEQLTLLAEEFQEGYCPPKPAQLTLCQQCDYLNLCRFKE